MLVQLINLPTDYRHVYLSPHFDDAALSLGGMIAAQHAAGERVLVVTVCSAAPRGPLNPFAAYLHARWGGDVDPNAIRRTEDAAAAARLGADLLWLDEEDAIYRHAAYSSVEAIFGAPVAGDPLGANLRQHLTQLHTHLPQARWYAPLAIGNHVDHQITQAVAAATLAGRADLAWYEDLPYATREGAVAERLLQLPGLISSTRDISATLPTKLAAIADYASQIGELFGDIATMRAQISAYAATVGGERIWAAASSDVSAEVTR
jgi:LmbE family N-acetylglucosaminyl deacetylase